jgi:F0F1-type ATP synthase assembly protein I
MSDAKWVVKGKRPVDSIKLALQNFDKREFLRQVNATEQDLERWLSSEEYIPLDVVRKACEINRLRGAPEQYSYLFDCLKGSEVRLSSSVREQVRAPPRKPKLPTKARIITAKPKRRDFTAVEALKMSSAFLLMLILGYAFYSLAQNLLPSYSPHFFVLGALLGLALAFVYVFSKAKALSGEASGRL